MNNGYVFIEGTSTGNIYAVRTIPNEPYYVCSFSLGQNSNRYWTETHIGFIHNKNDFKHTTKEKFLATVPSDLNRIDSTLNKILDEIRNEIHPTIEEFTGFKVKIPGRTEKTFSNKEDAENEIKIYQNKERIEKLAESWGIDEEDILLFLLNHKKKTQ